jgi:crotonobetainyl-CoA:carnitine CoA-transferase CaiB-like acyl-CoA transferase
MQPLAGVRVLDASHVVSGPVCCWLLAALGAEVLRVEPPGGDHTWRTLPFVGPQGAHRGARGPRDIAISPLRRGRGKRSLVLDLKTDAGRDVFRRLARLCDVLVENALPGSMERLGLDYASLAPSCPQLVYCSISGYGHEGPYRDHPSMDLVVQAVSGLMAKTGFPDGPPTKVGCTIGDQVPALFAALGIVSALRQREREGRGQRIDVAMLDSLLTLLWDEPIDDFEDQGLPERVGNGDPRGAPLDVFRSADGWLALVLTPVRRDGAPRAGRALARLPLAHRRARRRQRVRRAVVSDPAYRGRRRAPARRGHPGRPGALAVRGAARPPRRRARRAGAAAPPGPRRGLALPRTRAADPLLARRLRDRPGRAARREHRGGAAGAARRRRRRARAAACGGRLRRVARSSPSAYSLPGVYQIGEV